MRFTVAGSENSPIQGALLRALNEHGELSIPALRALTPLTADAQRIVDNTVLQVGLERLVVTADIMAAGLTYPLSDPLSVTQLEWNKTNKVGGAQRTMSPSARGENQLPNVIPQRIPIYLTTDDFNIPIRTLKVSQRVGQPLDTSLISQATRRVNEAIEDATINGSGFVAGGYSAPGILNAPNANTQTIATTWTDAATLANFTAGPRIFGEVEAAIGKLQADRKYGPYNLYVGTAYGNALDSDYKANGDQTIKDRLQKITAGGRPLGIKVADQMPANTAVLMQMTEDVIQIVDGQRPTVIPWTSADGFTLYWLVMAIIVPRVRDDYDGNSGICILSV